MSRKYRAEALWWDAIDKGNLDLFYDIILIFILTGVDHRILDVIIEDSRGLHLLIRTALLFQLNGCVQVYDKLQLQPVIQRDQIQ